VVVSRAGVGKSQELFGGNRGRAGGGGSGSARWWAGGGGAAGGGGKSRKTGGKLCAPSPGGVATNRLREKRQKRGGKKWHGYSSPHETWIEEAKRRRLAQRAAALRIGSTNPEPRGSVVLASARPWYVVLVLGV